MEFPKTVRKHCPFCRTHEEHQVKRVKAGGRAKAAFKKGDRYRRVKMNNGYGGTPYPIQANSKRYGVKTSKKVLIKLICGKCGKAHQYNLGRARKFELVQKD
ncbi:MAG: 50S ribosomal protein L44e [Candidatus Aenigmarchaeota archaeon]|nr:50S ribosomal protein L44e [Candidatus Aenigmarchaeota archaeon]